MVWTYTPAHRTAAWGRGGCWPYQRFISNNRRSIGEASAMHRRASPMLRRCFADTLCLKKVSAIKNKISKQALKFLGPLRWSRDASRQLKLLGDRRRHIGDVCWRCLKISSQIHRQSSQLAGGLWYFT